MKKLFFLFLALLLPVLIYLFLKTFGKNEFDVPVLFSDSVTVPVNCQKYSYRSPYHIADSILQKTAWSQNDSLTVLVFDDGNVKHQHERQIHITRIFEQFKTEPLHVVHVYKDIMVADVKIDRLTTLSLSVDNFELMRNCVFLLSPGYDAVIIDHQKRIRGHYKLTKREDADRMIMEEMNILFKRY